MNGLIRNTTYHFRKKAANLLGIVYGEDRTFRVTDPEGTVGTVTDIDGNTYKTIVIGKQVWMAENLRTTKLRDGTPIPNVTDVSNTQWPYLTTAAYCWYGNNRALYDGDQNGALYNWHAVNTWKLAPAGWHVPSRAEWKELILHLGSEGKGDGEMKEAGTAHWFSPNTGATNSSGFTALPSGARFDSGFTFMGEYGYWWSSTEEGNSDYAFYFYVNRDTKALNLQYSILLCFLISALTK